MALLPALTDAGGCPDASATTARIGVGSLWFVDDAVSKGTRVNCSPAIQLGLFSAARTVPSAELSRGGCVAVCPILHLLPTVASATCRPSNR